MPPRHTYWTIIFGNQPTSFRAATQEELLPTLRQIQSRHPDAVMMWFARGRLWHSDEEARAALAAQRMRRRPVAPKPRTRESGSGFTRREPRPRFGGAGAASRDSERRAPGWRPGGQHTDPRDRFKVPRDVKRRNMARKFGWKKKDEDK